MKVFIAVGTQLAFDRLVRTVDAWAAEHPEAEVFAQIGPAEYVPRHMEHHAFVPPAVFAEKSRGADLIIAHAGTGSIFTALELRTPIIVMPRLARYREHRNDHQLATVARFESIRGVNVARDEQELRRLLDRVEELERPTEGLSPHARPELLRAVSDFVNEEGDRGPRARLAKLLRSLRP